VLILEESPQFLVLKTTYLKDLSFEAPEIVHVSYISLNPAVSFDINIESKSLFEREWEVVLHVQISAKIKQQHSYVIEVKQAGVFLEEEGMERNALRRALSIQAPQLLYPYIVDTVNGLLSRGGLPVLSLPPPDFTSSYKELE
jgi:preprotein translocase subunit SecB